MYTFSLKSALQIVAWIVNVL